MMRRDPLRRIDRKTRSLPFFTQLSDREQELLWRLGTELELRPGTLVASSSEGGRQCTIVLNGTCAWSEPDLSGAFGTKRLVGPGAFLDEEALSWVCATEDGPGAFQVRAATEARVLAFHRSEFRSLVRQAPRIGRVASVCTAVLLAPWRPESPAQPAAASSAFAEDCRSSKRTQAFV
jgi:hypothetical protein